MVTNKEKLFKLGKKMTDRVPYKLGLEKLTEDCPEYWGLVNVLDDEMVDIALSMKQRVPMTLEEIAKAAGRSDTKALEDKLQEMSCIGLLEYNWENPQHKKQYLLPLFVPGAAEFFNMRKDFVDEHPEVCDFFERMSRLPLEKVTPMVPLGGAGIGAVCLRRQVQRQAGGGAFGNLHNPGVADYESVRAAVVKRGNIIGKLFQISAVRKNIDGYVNLFPFFVRIAAAELDFVKSKIVGKGAQAEIFARQIHRVRSEVQRREKFFHIAGGSKQLGTARFLLVHNLNLNERIVVLSGFKNNGNYHRIALKVSFEKALYGALNELLRVGNVKLF